MTNQPTDLITEYMGIVSDTEVPKLFHRWSMLTGIGALMGRRVWVDAGIDKYYPNLYVMFVAPPGTKKSTAIKIQKRFLTQAGYNNFSAERTSKEKFLLDLANNLSDEYETDYLERNLFSDLGDIGEDREVFITADEFTNFFGNNIFDFVSLLGELWDFRGEYVLRVKHGENVHVPNPTVSILSGCTPETIHNSFPASILGQGFFSRLLFVYAKGTDKEIAFPSPLEGDVIDEFATKLVNMRMEITGEVEYTPEARSMLESIYGSPSEIPDSRFTYYAARRFPQLLKLCLIHALADMSGVIKPEHVRRANTVLTHTEYFMPSALGALGRAASSPTTHRILEILDSNPTGIGFQKLWTYVVHDLRDVKELAEIMVNLQSANMIRTEGVMYYPNKRLKIEPDNEFYDWDYLTEEERG